MSETGRTQPHNAEAERSLLGALLFSPDRISEVAEMLQAEDFYDSRHEHLWAALMSLAEQNTPVDMVSVGEALKAAGKYDEVGGAPFLIELSQLVTSAAFLGHHCRIVSETATLRSLIREATEIVSEAFETRPDGDSVQKLLDASEQRVFQIAQAGDTSGVAPISLAITETFKRLDSRTGEGGLTGLTTGFFELDEMLAGMNKGELLIIAARPSMGKTAFALNLIENAAMSKPDWLERPPSVAGPPRSGDEAGRGCERRRDDQPAREIGGAHEQLRPTALRDPDDNLERPVGDRLGEGLVLGWVDPVQPATQDSDGPAAGIEGCRVCLGVDPLGESAEHGDAGLGEQPGHLAGPGPALAARVARPDNGQREGVVGTQLPAVEENRRPVVHPAEVERVIGVEDGR